MDRGRLKLEARGEPMLAAYRELLLPDEEAFVLPATLARAELEALSAESRWRLVEAFAARFPNSHEPDKTERVLAFVRQQVAVGAIALVKRV
jgi:hypothetical protein